MVLVFYTAWISPFEFGFLRAPRHPLSVIDNLVNGFFAIDIVLTFFVAFLEKTSHLLVDSPNLIALRYIKTGFFPDVISTIPSELPRNLFPSVILYGYCSLLRLWRLVRISAMFERYSLPTFCM